MSIKTELMLCIEELKKRHPVSEFKNEEYYLNWLSQTYYFVRHSTALLGYSLPHLKNDDLRHHFEKHLGEETRHDVVALKDLQKMNHSINEYEEYNLTQAFYQNQYYKIMFEGGTSLLGYILFLEGIAVHWGKDFYQEVKDIHRGHSFLRVHVEEDPEHLESAIKTIMSLPEKEQEAILRNLKYSYEMYSLILDHARQQKQKLKAA